MTFQELADAILKMESYELKRDAIVWAQEGFPTTTNRLTITGVANADGMPFMETKK